MAEMLSLEDARSLVLSHVPLMPIEEVDLLDVVGRVAAEDIKSDIDVAPFAHSAMDGYALRAQDIAAATPETPVVLDVIGEEGAGHIFEDPVGPGQCLRIMTGAPMPDGADSVVKYEIVQAVSEEGKTGGQVAFNEPTSLGSNVRQAGEDAKAGEVVVAAGEVIHPAGVGFLASCGALQVATYARPRVAVFSTGSELVHPSEVPTRGKIRNSNCYALAACVKEAGCVPVIMPFVEDTLESISAAVRKAAQEYDFVVTTGGASDGDYDFIKPAIESQGELYMTLVNMRPGKAQAFGMVEGTPVFGLPGNPAAAYVGFEMLIRPALLKMQGYSDLERSTVQAALAVDMKKRDPRRILLRCSLARDDNGNLVAVPADNQSSGLFSAIQRSNCLAVMPEGLDSKKAGDVITCILLDIPEGLQL